MKNNMYTPEEAYYAVRERREVPKVTPCGDEVIDKVCNLIVERINNGWLGCNLRILNLGLKDQYRASRFLEDLGYKLDKDFIAYWLYHPTINRLK